jgi:exonuclease SbcD
LPTRRMHTIRVDVTAAADPQAELLAQVQAAPITDSIVRLIYRLKPEQAQHIHPAQIQAALAPAHSYTIEAQLVEEQPRQRLTQVDLSQALNPMTVLEQYIDESEELQPLKNELLLAAQTLLAGTEPDQVAPPPPAQLPLVL